MSSPHDFCKLVDYWGKGADAEGKLPLNELRSHFMVFARAILTTVFIAALTVASVQSQEAATGIPDTRVEHIAVSGDGQIIALTYHDNPYQSRVDLLDAATGAHLSSADLTPYRLRMIDLSPNGDRLLWTNGNGVVGVFTVASGTNELVSNTKGMPTEAVDWTADGERMGFSYGGRLFLFNATTKKVIGVMVSGVGTLTSIAFSPDGTSVATSHEAVSVTIPTIPIFTTQLWEIPPDEGDIPFIIQTPARTYAGLGGNLSWSPDGQELAASKYGGRHVLEWETPFSVMHEEAGFERIDIETDSRGNVPYVWPFTSVVRWSPDGGVFATGGRVFSFTDVITHQQIWEMESNDYPTDLQWAPDGRHIYHNGGLGGAFAVNELTLEEWQAQNAVPPVVAATSTPVVPTYAPSPVRLVTVSPDYLGRWFAAYYLDDSGTEPRLLFTPFLQAYPDTVACSPDSSRVATNAMFFINSVNLRSGVAIGADAVLEPAQYYDFDWSPMDNRLVYARKAADTSEDESGVFHIDLDTLEVTPLFLTGPNRVSSPRWSPDGTQIVFTEQNGGYGPMSSTALWLMNADGTNRRQLTAYLPGRHDFSPDWSPLGGEIVFSRNGTLMLTSEDGAKERTVLTPLTGESSSWSPLFSPDGQHIAFVANEEEQNAIYVIGRDGSNLRRIRELARFGNLECWLSVEPPNLDKVRG